jgi:ankyrin repeat protein
VWRGRSCEVGGRHVAIWAPAPPPPPPPSSPLPRRFHRINMSTPNEKLWAAAAVGDVDGRAAAAGGAGVGAGGGSEMSLAEARAALRLAAEAGDVAGITAALATGVVDADGIARDGYDGDDEILGIEGPNPLWLAAASFHLPAFRMLLAAGADPTVVHFNKSVVLLAVSGDNAALVREAIAAREAAAPSLSLLHAAAALDDDGAGVRAALARLPQSMAVHIEQMNAKATEDDGGGTALHVAAACGNAGAVVALLEAGAAVEVVDAAGTTPLLIASRYGHVEAIKVLLAGGAAVNQTDSDGCTPLSAASERGRVDAVMALLAGGADVDAADKYGRSSLYVASECGHVGAIRALLAGGADVKLTNWCRSAPLHAASSCGHVEAVQVLLAAGADVNAHYRFGFPLYVASEFGHVDAIKALLANGANVNAADRLSRTSLYAASASGHAGAVNALLAAGADVNAADKRGVTPLHEASRYSRSLAIAALLAGGADATAVEDATGCIAAQVVRGLPLWAHAAVGAPPCDDVVDGHREDADAALALHALLREAAAWRRRRPAVVSCAEGALPLFAHDQ